MANSQQNLERQPPPCQDHSLTERASRARWKPHRVSLGAKPSAWGEAHDTLGEGTPPRISSSTTTHPPLLSHSHPLHQPPAPLSHIEHLLNARLCWNRVHIRVRDSSCSRGWRGCSPQRGSIACLVRQPLGAAVEPRKGREKAYWAEADGRGGPFAPVLAAVA